MENQPFVRRKRGSELFGVFLVIPTIIFLQTVQIDPIVKTVVQRIIHLPVNVINRVTASTVVENTKVHLTHFPNTWRLYKEYRKIKCFNKMKLFSINCQSWKTAKSDFGEIVDNYNIDVLCLTETFESYKEPVSFRQWSKLSKPRKDGYGGVAVLYKDSDDGVIGDGCWHPDSILTLTVFQSRRFFTLARPYIK